MVAGSGERGVSNDGGPATASPLDGAFALAFDAQGNMYLAQSVRISKVDPNGEITTVAGTETPGYSGDGGPANEAELGSILDQLAADSEGSVYVADRRNHAIRRIDSEGVITTVAETGGSGIVGGPSGVAVGRDGNVYFGERDRDTVNRIEADGTITRVAGGRRPGSSGDGGPATEAELDTPYSLVFDASGNLYIGDQKGLRKVDTDGFITTVIEGAAVNHLAPDGEGNLYLANFENRSVSRLSPDGELTVILEAGEYAWADDGPAEPAPLVNPGAGVAVDADGNVYLSDSPCACVYRLEQ